MQKLKPVELRLMTVSEEERKKVKKNSVYIILDNVLDTYNIGAVFRLADAVAAEKVLLCGGTETPPNHRIKKASINTTEWVAWSYFPTAVEALQELKNQNSKIKIYGIDYTFPIALVVGHETDGVSKDVLDLCDQIVEIPMWGVNTSLNVMVSLSIVLFEVMKQK